MRVINIINDDKIINLRDLLSNKLEKGESHIYKFEVWKRISVPVRKIFLFPIHNMIREKLKAENDL